jgi:hypothetical protein
MAYAKDYLGDTVATGVLIPTVQGIAGIIPGVTVKPELAGLIGAQTAEFWYDVAPAVEDATAGDDFDVAQVGSKKATIVMERALHANEKIPQVAIDAINIDIVGAKTLQLATAIGNKLGSKFITDLLALAQAKTYVNGLDFVDAIADGIATFKAGVSAKLDGSVNTTFSNATNGIMPTTILIGTTGEKLLRQDADFKNLFEGQGALPGTLGTLFGLQVVVSQHVSAVDFVLLNHQGVAYPYSLNMLRAVPSELFNGVKLQAELVYPNASEASVLVIDSFAMKFTEASGS